MNKRETLKRLEMRIKSLIDNRGDLEPNKYETLLDMYVERYLELKRELEQ